MKFHQSKWILVLCTAVALSGCEKSLEIERGSDTKYRTSVDRYFVIKDRNSFRFLYTWITKKEGKFPRIDFTKENVALAVLPGRAYSTKVSFTNFSVDDEDRPVLSLLETRPKRITWQRFFKRRPWSFARFRSVPGKSLLIDRYKKKGSRGKVKFALDALWKRTRR